MPLYDNILKAVNLPMLLPAKTLFDFYTVEMFSVTYTVLALIR